MVDRLFKILQKNSIKACWVLTLLLVICFFPAVVGTKSLMVAAWDAPSVMQYGAYCETPPEWHIYRTADPGACAWQTEPWFKIESQQYEKEGNLPLWDPHSGFGIPLAAGMIPQPFYPLTMLLTLHPTPYTYTLFLLARLFVAGVFMFLFMRWFVPFFPSIFSAVGFMLTGYFIGFLNISHLSVEVLLPAVFWAFEGVLRRKSLLASAEAAVIVTMSILGGMPESTFLILIFGYIYFFVRMFLNAKSGREMIVHVRNFVLVNLFGFALAAFLLFPFLEFMRISHDLHQPANVNGLKAGLEYDGDPRSLIGSFFPGLRAFISYWGLMPVLFALFALEGYFPKSRKSLGQPLVQLSLFFETAILFMLLKRYGSPAVNWVGGLPLFDMIVFPKYLEPLLAFSWAALAGIGFSVVMAGKIRPSIFLLNFGCVLGTVLVLSILSVRTVGQCGMFTWIFFISLIVAIILLFVVSRSYSIFFKEGKGFSGLVQCGAVALLALEMSLNYLVPCFYVYNTLPPLNQNPYDGAPYLRFLNSINTDRARVFGRNYLLYPNWAGVFDLDDVRCLDGMYYKRYFNFIRAFLLKPGSESRTSGDLADRFTGADPDYSYDFESDAERRFLELSSVRYLVTEVEYGATPTLVKDIFSQHKDERLWGFGVDYARMGHKGIPFLFQHPPSHRVSYHVKIDEKMPVLEFCVLIKPEAQDKTDGIAFLLELRSDAGIEELFSASLTPKARLADREPLYQRIDLSKYAGREVDLLFSTDPVLTTHVCWGGWGAVRFTAAVEDEPASAFKEIYNEEASIFEFPHVLPRSTVYYGIELMEDEDCILRRLKDSSFDIWRNTLVWGRPLSDYDRKRLQEIGSARVREAVPAHIISYKSQRVVIEASAEEPSLLMLNDANYPGWQVYVNGRRESMMNVDYLFRGVILPRGNSTVEFIYRPFSFAAGAVVSLLAMIAGLALVVFKVITGTK